jgi:hypothetical protein
LAALLLSALVALGVPGFHARVAPLSPAQQAAMTGVSWHRGCPVPLSALRMLTLSYVGFDGRVHTGQLVANADAASTLVGVFRDLYAARFPIRRMVPVDAYKGNDDASVQADNTSAFNCRRVQGTTSWSEHAYGRAIDVNPIENPDMNATVATKHPASKPYFDRTRHRPGMAWAGGVLVRAFSTRGWGWGGVWGGEPDYQHFSSTGR